MNSKAFKDIVALYVSHRVAFDATITVSNKASYVAYRGPWEVETWVRERLLDQLAVVTRTGVIGGVIAVPWLRNRKAKEVLQ